ncbi:aminotransferase class IV [Piscinibacter sakaiensis]|uniref:aminotransferase class IV n=1 Tax=Piscinibacter sakaiensis TaxID=1547922 RepID=UPI0037276854
MRSSRAARSPARPSTTPWTGSRGSSRARAASTPAPSAGSTRRRPATPAPSSASAWPTDRARYDAGVRAAEAAGAFDTLFLTADGRLVEGGRSSLFLRLDGRWYTPPLTDGALPGVMRAEVLDDPRWAAAERTLRLDDLVRAEAVMVCNALRGCREAVVVR